MSRRRWSSSTLESVEALSTTMSSSAGGHRPSEAVEARRDDVLPVEVQDDEGGADVVLAQSFASTVTAATPRFASELRGAAAHSLTCRYDAFRGGKPHASASRGAMNDCFIVGSGRSGTSMVAGLLAQSGYFMGNKLDAYYGDTNPKGFFEDPDINAINERILHPIIPRRPREPIGRIFFPRRSVAWSFWLTYVSPEALIPRPAAGDPRIGFVRTRSSVRSV